MCIRDSCGPGDAKSSRLRVPFESQALKRRRTAVGGGHISTGMQAGKFAGGPADQWVDSLCSDWRASGPAGER
eukprot:9302042-Alexandrium_andersonii.AAC.1